MVSVSSLHISALLLRLGLVIYGEWQDSNYELKFTDVDYHVFTDAAKYVLDGHTPYLRETYRYTPILAWLLVPCHLIHILWGKLVFIAADMLTGVLIQGVLQTQNCDLRTIKASVSLWLFSPITMTISSRGNAESVILVFLIGTILALLKKRALLAGFLLGISVHLKVFPIVTIVTIIFFLSGNFIRRLGMICKEFSLVSLRRDLKYLTKTLFSKEILGFFICFLLTILASTVFFYTLYGNDFLENAYFYHVTRKDIRHNFSVYFYMLYTSREWWLSVVCFFNQTIVLLAISFSFYQDLPFCSFLLIYSFVTFNKICTSQYFLWYLTLIPMLVPGLASVPMLEVVTVLAFWAAGQGAWLTSAYFLEFEGQSVFFYVWLSSLIFFVINVLIICWFMKRYRPIYYVSPEQAIKKSI